MSGPEGSVRDLDIVAIATTLPGQAGDGTPEFVLTLAAAMKSSRVVIVAPRIRNGRLIDSTDGVDIRRVPYARAGREQVAEDAILPALRSDPRLLRQVPRLLFGLLQETRRQLNERKPQVLHAHWILPAGLLALGLTRRSKTPYIVTAHGADAYALDGKVGQALKRRILRNALAVYPVSTDIAERLTPLAGDRMGPTLPMGVDCERLAHTVGQRTPQAGTVLFVGRLSDKKGVDTLLHAVAATPAVTQLRIVGDGPDRTDLQELATTLGIGDRVHFAGHANRTAVMDEYRNAHIVAVPSRQGAGGDQDGTPVVLMEAMAIGIPIVATALGGIAEQVTNNSTGLLVDPDAPDQLAAALDQLLTNDELAEQLGRAAADHARTSIDIHAIASQMEAHIRSRLAERHTG
jgi:glycosyltransferase involved in cell wall biosynthesis